MCHRNDWYLFLVCLRAVGGEVGATSSLAPKIGPLGLVRARWQRELLTIINSASHWVVNHDLWALCTFPLGKGSLCPLSPI